MATAKRSTESSRGRGESTTPGLVTLTVSLREPGSLIELEQRRDVRADRADRHTERPTRRGPCSHLLQPLESPSRAGDRPRASGPLGGVGARELASERPPETGKLPRDPTLRT